MPLLPDVLACLREITELEPAQAKKITNELRRKYPGIPMRLVWQRDSPGGPCHYDMLITLYGGVVSLAFAPDRALPWPLRGAQHAGEQTVLRVNGRDITMEQAVAVLDVLWSDASLAMRLVNASLVEEELDRHPVELPAPELQEALDAFRRARGLLTVQATRDWMAERGLDHAHLEQIVSREAAVARLRQRVATDAAAEFAADPAGYDVLCVLRLRYPDPVTASAAATRLQEADPLGQSTRETLDHGATVGVDRLHRRDLGTLGADARVGCVLGPVGSTVFRVLEVRPAVLDTATRQAIEKRLFERWLADRRRTAGIEWRWGTAPRTTALTETLREPASV
ncbi:hypothetical protein GCM10010517_79910 [Streptosporangium fragile]|uniref:TIGR04500 family peptide maturation system protein n=1 Tax=Streptosporangium fragile TaxID=46186 RepID=A0ABP6IXQ5_9ACTN